MDCDTISIDYKEALFAVLRSALHSEKLLLSENIDIEKLLHIAAHQNLFPLVFFKLMSNKDFESTEVYKKYLPRFYASFSSQVRRTGSFLELYPKFTEKGIYPVVVKGIVCRQLYGEFAECRLSGDEDILIEKKDYTKAVEIIESCGYRSDEQPDKALKVAQEVTFYSPNVNGKPVLTVELHLNPFGIANASRNKMNTWFENIFQRTEIVDIQGIEIRTMSPTDHFLFLVFHAFKHFSGSGFGVRMMLDILLYAEKYEEKIDWKYIDDALNDVGACGFFADLVNIGNDYLGFQFAERYETVSPKDLLDDMFQTGTFGNSKGTDRTAGRIVADAVGADGKNKNKFASYVRLLFPSWKTWISWKPYLSDKPWLLPMEWIKRITHYLRGETSTRNIDEIDKSYELANSRLTLLRKYGLL